MNGHEIVSQAACKFFVSCHQEESVPGKDEVYKFIPCCIIEFLPSLTICCNNSSYPIFLAKGCFEI